MHSQPRLGTTCRLVAFAGSVLAGAQACSGTLSSNWMCVDGYNWFVYRIGSRVQSDGE